jgi:predicted HTH transcriptional regulator
MANRRDGGRVIVGVAEGGSTLDPVGLSDPDIATWNYDDVAAGVAVYADPSVSFDLEPVASQGKAFVVLRVREFEEIPILCKADFTPTTGAILRAGACYVRSRRKPETTEIPTHEDMRALIEVATDKGIRRWIAQNQRAGVVTLGVTTPPLDQARFDAQLGDLR